MAKHEAGNTTFLDGEDTPLFKGETMTCVMCGKIEQSKPDTESNWRCLELNGKMHYVCPKHFPKDGASAKAFQKAYLKIFQKLGYRP
jgi:hypothetical protein